MNLKIYVCVKHVPDSAAPIVVRNGVDIEENVTFLVNPYDEHALTEAARLRDGAGDGEVVAVCLAPPAGEATLRSALAMGADRGLLIAAERPPDPQTTAAALKAGIEQDAGGRPDLILTGKESIDHEGMQTMFRLARLFDMPAATNVVEVTRERGALGAVCEKEAGARERLRLRMPCVLGAGKGLNTPRYPTFPEIVRARKKPLAVLSMAALSFPAPAGRLEVLRRVPALEERAPKEIAGGPQEIARRIVAILRDEARVI